jgi:hypothetical protein
MRNQAVTVGFLLAVCLGCSGDDCDSIGMPEPPAIRVQAWDAVTGSPITGARGFIQSTGVRQDFEESSDNEYWAYGSPGTYIVVLTADGYSIWSQDEVVVKSGTCGYPVTVALRADLQPTSGGLLVPGR